MPSAVEDESAAAPSMRHRKIASQFLTVRPIERKPTAASSSFRNSWSVMPSAAVRHSGLTPIFCSREGGWRIFCAHREAAAPNFTTTAPRARERERSVRRSHALHFGKGDGQRHSPSAKLQDVRFEPGPAADGLAIDRDGALGLSAHVHNPLSWRRVPRNPIAMCPPPSSRASSCRRRRGGNRSIA